MLFKSDKTENVPFRSLLLLFQAYLHFLEAPFFIRVGDRQGVRTELVSNINKLFKSQFLLIFLILFVFK